MAFTRKFLSALGIEAEKVDEIITAHAEVVDALKEQRDVYKKDAEALPEVKKELEKYKNSEGDDYKEKYKTIKKEFDDYKKEQDTKATVLKKTDAYKKILKEAGISDKRIDTILKVSADSIGKIDFDENGEVKDKDKYTESIKSEWADFIVTSGKEGAKTYNPPNNTKGFRTLADIYADEKLAKDTTARQKAIAEAIEANPEAF